MNDRSGLLTLAAYMTATTLIVLVAFLGIFRYGAQARISALGPIPSEPTPELAATGLQLSSESPSSSASLDGLAQQRVQLLESMLANKTALVRRQAKQIEMQVADLDELRQRYDEVMVMAIESLQSELVSEPVDLTVDPSSTEAIDPEKMETELMLARAVHDALVSDVEALQDELDRVYAEMGRLRDESDATAAIQLRDALVLESASASVLLRVGRQAVPALTDALTDTNPVVRRWAATVLGGMGQDAGEASTALTEATLDSDPGVRRAAKAALDAIER